LDLDTGHAVPVDLDRLCRGPVTRRVHREGEGAGGRQPVEAEVAALAGPFGGECLAPRIGHHDHRLRDRLPVLGATDHACDSARTGEQDVVAQHLVAHGDRGRLRLVPLGRHDQYVAAGPGASIAYEPSAWATERPNCRPPMEISVTAARATTPPSAVRTVPRTPQPKAAVAVAGPETEAEAEAEAPTPAVTTRSGTYSGTGSEDGGGIAPAGPVRDDTASYVVWVTEVTGVVWVTELTGRRAARAL
jgi:hypothetical protein